MKGMTNCILLNIKRFQEQLGQSMVRLEIYFAKKITQPRFLNLIVNKEKISVSCKISHLKFEPSLNFPSCPHTVIPIP
jgi:hypothetical protein